MSVPIIDFKSESVLDEIRKAYTTVGFAVFTKEYNKEIKSRKKNLKGRKIKEKETRIEKSK